MYTSKQSVKLSNGNSLQNLKICPNRGKSVFMSVKVCNRFLIIRSNETIRLGNEIAIVSGNEGSLKFIIYVVR